MKRIVSLILAAVLLAGVLGACGAKDTGGKLDIPQDVNQVHAIFTMYSSYLYNVVDPQTVSEIADLCRSIEYAKPTAEPNDDDTMEMCSLSFYQYGEIQKSIGITPGGFLYIYGADDFELYQITSSFDLDSLKELIKQYDAN